MAGSGSCSKVAMDFNGEHNKHITYNTDQTGSQTGRDNGVFTEKWQSFGFGKWQWF